MKHYDNILRVISIIIVGVSVYLVNLFFNFIPNDIMSKIISNSSNLYFIEIMIGIDISVFIIIIFDYIYKISSERIKVRREEKSNIRDISKLLYYREEFENISPLIVSKLIKRKSNINDEIVSLVLYLENKKIILRNNNNKITRINNTDKLLKHEEYFIENYENILYKIEKPDDIRKEWNNINEETRKKYNIPTIINELEEFYNLVEEDMAELSFVEINNKKDLSTIVMPLALLAFFACFPLFGMYIEQIEDYPLLFALSFGLLFFSFAIILLSKKLVEIYDKKTRLIKTKKGLELTNNLMALKRFIKDFSILHDRKLEEIKLWDSYLICTIIFDIPGELNKRSNELYKILVPNNKKNTIITKLIFLISINIISIPMFIVAFTLDSINIIERIAGLIIILLFYISFTFFVIFTKKI